MDNITMVDVVKIELEKGRIFRSFSHHPIGRGDVNGNKYGVEVFKNDGPVNLSGAAAIGYFIRPDRQTVIIQGEISGNEASVILPASCYAVEGVFTLAIKIYGNEITGTMRIVDGTVIRTETDDVVDPGGIIPDIDELMAVIGRAEDAAEDIAKFSVTEQLISGDDYRVIVSVTE